MSRDFRGDILRGMDEPMEMFFDLPESAIASRGTLDPVFEDCMRVAAEILERERYLTWAEREFLENVALGNPFDESRMRAIASNWGVFM